MSNYRILRLFAFTVVLIGSSMLCDTRPIETLEQLEGEDMTRVAAEVISIDQTGTAEAPTATPTLPPTSTPTLFPPTPTPTEDIAQATLDALLTEQAAQPDFNFANLPPASFALSDPPGDTQICADGSAVDDSAVDIQTIEFYNPADIQFDFDGWMIRVGLGQPADETFANDWSAALLSAYAIQGAETYTVTLNQTHNFTLTVGTLDPTTGQVRPGTEDNSFVDDSGYIWFLIPTDTVALQLASFHLPSADMPEDQKRCDVAPNEGQFTFSLP